MKFHLIVCFLVLSNVSCGESYESFDTMVEAHVKGTVDVVKVAQLVGWMTSETPVLLDARAAKEFRISHIHGARNIGYNKPDWTVLEGVDKQQTIVVYCSIGYRSERIGETLKKKGYGNVYNLYGGIFDWVNKGNQVVNKDGETQKIHGYSKRWSKWLTSGEKVVD
jgi:rhodanese-related sulfurtransferase